MCTTKDLAIAINLVAKEACCSCKCCILPKEVVFFFFCHFLPDGIKACKTFIPFFFSGEGPTERPRRIKPPRERTQSYAKKPAIRFVDDQIDRAYKTSVEYHVPGASVSYQQSADGEPPYDDKEYTSSNMPDTELQSTTLSPTKPTTSTTTTSYGTSSSVSTTTLSSQGYSTPKPARSVYRSATIMVL